MLTEADQEHIFSRARLMRINESQRRRKLERGDMDIKRAGELRVRDEQDFKALLRGIPTDPSRARVLEDQ